MIFAKDSPNQPAPKPLRAYLHPLKDADAWWFMLFYGVTFGGFSGLTSSLSIYFTDQFGLSTIVAGYCTAACVFAGALVSPLGGAFADSFGGITSLSRVYTVEAAALVAIRPGPSTVALARVLCVIAMLPVGLGLGAVFQRVRQRIYGENG